MDPPGNPLIGLLGLALGKVSGDRRGMHFAFRDGKVVAATLDAASRTWFTTDAGESVAPSKEFIRRAKWLKGELVSDVRYVPGDRIVLVFGGDAELAVSLRRPDFEGDVAADLRVRGEDFVHFHDDGVTRLATRPTK